MRNCALFVVLAGAMEWLSPTAMLAAGAPVVHRLESGEVPIMGAAWALARSNDGTRWIGSNVLAVDDGDRWRTFDLSGAYAFRAIAAGSDGRVWYGARGALGYLERNMTGRWETHSLLLMLRQSDVRDPGDIWHASPLGRGAAFVTSDRVLRWDGARFEEWALPAKIRLQAFTDGDSLLIYQAGTGFMRLRATGAPELEFAEHDLPEKPVTWYVALGDGSAMLGLGESAYLLRTASQAGPATSRFQRLSALSETLRDALPTCAVKTADLLVAVGTFKRGVVIADTSGTIQAVVDSNAGLGDDAVYALCTDEHLRIWAGLGNGCAMIESPRRVTVFDVERGLAQGTPLKVLSAGGAAPFEEVLTSKTLYAVAPGSLPMLIQPQPVLWDAARIDGRVWIGGFGGLWTVDGTRSIHEHYVSADVTRIIGSSHFPGAVIFLENYELKALEKGPYGWVPRKLGPRVDDTPLSLLEDTRGEVWVSTLEGGIHRFAWVDQPGAFPVLRLLARYSEGLGLPLSESHPRLTILGGRLYAFCSNDILVLNEARTAFEPAPGFEGFIGVAAAPASPDAALAYWIVNSRRLGSIAPPAVIRVEDAGGGVPPRWFPVEAPALEAGGQVTAFDIATSAAGPAIWIGGSRRLLRLPIDALTLATDAPALGLRGEQADGEPLSLDAAESHELPPSTRRIAYRFFAAQTGAPDPFFYQTRLEGVEPSWSAPTADPMREFTGLAPGHYRLAARALDRFGRAGPTLSRNFFLLAPWHRRPAALIAFSLAGVLFVAGLVRWRLLRLRRQNERLNQLVADRTRELELINAAKGDFLENISHELRNPLNGLSGLLELMHEDQLGPREVETVRFLKACTETLTRVFEEVLGYAKLEYGSVSVQRRPFLLGDLFCGLSDLFSPQAERQGGSIRIRLPEDFADGFEGDAGKIKTILGNFVSNALKYAPGSPIELSAEVRPAAVGAIDLFIEVTDHGPGVPLDEQELIFQKFVRGSSAARQGVVGAGLGLATCRVLARALNGDIGVESEPGHGATFYVRLLVTRAAAAPCPAARTVSTEAGRQLPAPPTAGLPALVVDDEAYNQTVMKGIALSLGYAVETAASARDAIALVEKAAFGVVFLDWELPDGKGGDIARFIRSRPGGEAPLIIATTAHDGEDMPRRCSEAGIDGFLLKPYNLERVGDMIKTLGVRRIHGAESSTPQALSPKDALNIEAFAHYARAVPARAAEAVQLFVASVDSELDVLQEAVAKRDADRAEFAAHRLCSLGGIAGAAECVRLARRLEAVARTRQTASLASLQHDLLAEWHRVRMRLAELPPISSSNE